MPRYTRCPFYIDENRKTISCEDVCRSYDSLNEKLSWMDLYCDSWDWAKCPYAVDLSEAYRRYEEGDEMALVEQELKANKKEIESLIRKLGRANKKIERMQKKIDELRSVNQSFTAVNESLENQKRSYFEKWKEADAKLKEYEKKIADQLGALAGIYEQRMCYLIDKCIADGKFYDSEAEAWAGDKEFALMHDADEGGRYWKVVFKEDGESNNVQVSEEQGESK